MAAGAGRIAATGPLANLELVDDSSTVSIAETGTGQIPSGEVEHLVGEGWVAVDAATVPELEPARGRENESRGSIESLFSPDLSTTINEAVASFDMEEVAAFRDEVADQTFLEELREYFSAGSASAETEEASRSEEIPGQYGGDGAGAPAVGGTASGSPADGSGDGGADSPKDGDGADGGMPGGSGGVPVGESDGGAAKIGTENADGMAAGDSGSSAGEADEGTPAAGDEISTTDANATAEVQLSVADPANGTEFVDATRPVVDGGAENVALEMEQEIENFKQILSELVEEHCIQSELAEQIEASLWMRDEVHGDQKEKAKEDLMGATERFIDALEAAQEKAMRMKTAVATDEMDELVSMLASILGMKQAMMTLGILSMGEDRELTKVEWKGGLAYVSEGPQGPAIAQKKPTRILDMRDRFKKFEGIIDKMRQGLEAGLRRTPKISSPRPTTPQRAEMAERRTEQRQPGVQQGQAHGGQRPVTNRPSAPIARPETARKEKTADSSVKREEGDTTTASRPETEMRERVAGTGNSRSASGS